MDKKTYWDNREKGLRGQGITNTVKFYPKGEKIEYTTREGEKSEYPNAQGQNMIKDKKGLRMVNRIEARRKSRSHPATKKNFDFQVKENHFRHAAPKKV